VNIIVVNKLNATVYLTQLCTFEIFWSKLHNSNNISENDFHKLTLEQMLQCKRHFGSKAGVSEIWSRCSWRLETIWLKSKQGRAGLFQMNCYHNLDMTWRNLAASLFSYKVAFLSKDQNSTKIKFLTKTILTRISIIILCDHRPSYQSSTF
jgi:hypothetical protein